jgi:peptidoglycan/xylan/chitin deacetylase (PgdA/CDA1 family)
VQQLTVLRRIANVVPLRDALTALEQGRTPGVRAVALTFDDGYRDNLTVAGPILRRLGLPATCFLVPGLLSGRASPWWEKLAWAFARRRCRRIEWQGRLFTLDDVSTTRQAFSSVADQLKRADRIERDAAVDEIGELLRPHGEYFVADQFLGWDGARQLCDFMEIGSHSRYHAILSQESAQAQEADLREAKRELQEGLDRAISVLAYPNGRRSDYNASTVTAAAMAGYTHALTTMPGLNTAATPRYEIRRIVMNPERGAFELLKLVRNALH